MGNLTRKTVLTNFEAVCHLYARLALSGYQGTPTPVGLHHAGAASGPDHTECMGVWCFLYRELVASSLQLF